MRKCFFLTALLAAFTFSGAMAQTTLLDEGFENMTNTSKSDDLPDGWTKVSGYTGSNLGYRWTSGYSSSGSTMTGHHYVYADAPTYSGAADGFGPRKEILLTPELTLSGTYQLSVDWEAAAYSALHNGDYKLQIAVVDVAKADTTEIFDFTNEQQLRDSGVPADPYGQYLWQNWGVHNSKLSLAAWQGRKVKVAFIYNLIHKTGNILYLDNISVKQFTPDDGPKAEVDQNQYNFGTMYIGEKHYSEQFTLKNTGLSGLKVTGFEAPEGIGLNMDTVGLNLTKNGTTTFQLWYKAGFTTPVNADAVLKTNGGDVTIKVSATKEAVPDGYSLELFEGTQFPPAGWKNDGFNSTYYAIEGDHSAVGTPYFSDTYLTTPRLDLSNKDFSDPKLMFTYYSRFVSEDGGTYPYNDLSVWVSTDGGKTFNDSLWVDDYTKYDTLINVTVDLAKYVGNDNVVVRFKNSAVPYDASEGAAESADFIIDRVLLPSVYGAEGTPLITTLVSPTDSAQNIFPKNIQLKWLEAQFATGYKLYVGTSATTSDVLDGKDVGNVLTYTIDDGKPATTYYWHVIAYNDKGAGISSPTWSFTTQADYTVKTFPWVEDFEKGTFAPLGWNKTGGTYTKWDRTTYHPYDGEASAMCYSNETEVEGILTSPDIQVPADAKGYQLSFFWGNDRPVSLVADKANIHKNNSTKDDGIDAVMLDIYSDGAWKQVRLISDNAEADGNRYWAYETVDLSPYAGKTIALRWRYVSHNYNRSRGASLDNVTISTADASALSVNTDRWDAYKVNAGQSETSPSITLANLGSKAATVTKVSFTQPGFSTTLAQGAEVPAAGVQKFTITFDASKVNVAADSVVVTDSLVANFNDGSVITIPVSGIALAKDVLFYGFEHDAPGQVPAGFKGIDVDGLATVTLYFWSVPNVGTPLSFFVVNDTLANNVLKEPNGHQSLMTRCNENGAFEDWIVSDSLFATKTSKFQYDVRNWESINSVLPASTPTVKVLVSTTSQTDRNSFTEESSFTPELFNEKNWDRITVDLSKYAGKKVYVALASSSSNCLGAFYDNFEFQHFSKTSGITDVSADELRGPITVYGVNGVVLATGEHALEGLSRGVYVVRTATGKVTKVVK